MLQIVLKSVVIFFLHKLVGLFVKMIATKDSLDKILSFIRSVVKAGKSCSFFSLNQFNIDF